ncbi:MAG: sulfotransferase, partial [Rubripirellula sp.]
FFGGAAIIVTSANEPTSTSVELDLFRATNPSCWHNWAIGFERKEDRDGACDFFRYAIMLDPTDARLRYDYGIALARNSLLAASAVAFSEASQRDPSWDAPRQATSRIALATHESVGKIRHAGESESDEQELLDSFAASVQPIDPHSSYRPSVRPDHSQDLFSANSSFADDCKACVDFVGAVEKIWPPHHVMPVLLEIVKERHRNLALKTVVIQYCAGVEKEQWRSWRLVTTGGRNQAVNLAMNLLRERSCFAVSLASAHALMAIGEYKHAEVLLHRCRYYERENESINDLLRQCQASPDKRIASRSLFSVRETPCQTAAETIRRSARKSESAQEWEVAAAAYVSAYWEDVKSNSCSSRDFLADAQASISTFTVDYFQNRVGWGLSTMRPVFLIGLPHCGAYQLSQLLSQESKFCVLESARDMELVAHQVFAKANSNEAGDVVSNLTYPNWQSCLATLSRRHIWQFAQPYGHAMQHADRHAQFVVNPASYNVLYAGLILTIFPNAKFIVCDRDVSQIAIQCLRDPIGVPADTPFGLEAYARAVYQQMAHWFACKPSSFFHVDFDDLGEKPRSVVQQVSDFCDETMPNISHPEDASNRFKLAGLRPDLSLAFSKNIEHIARLLEQTHVAP